MNKLFNPIKYWWQKHTRGYTNEDIFCVATSTASILVPRMKALLNQVKNRITPMTMTNQEWCDILNQIIYAFELISRENGSWVWTKKEEEAVEIGLDLFRKHYFSLWW